MQSNAPNWGLGRLSHRVKGVTDYEYESSAGQGACAYILDTGLNAAHTEFEGRAKYLTRFSGESDEDGVGHGTHVAGIIGSKAYGVAKKAKLFSVKVSSKQLPVSGVRLLTVTTRSLTKMAAAPPKPLSMASNSPLVMPLPARQNAPKALS